MRQPDFFIVGAAKSGTTSLVEYLNQHKNIFIPNIKEPNFFGKDLVVNSKSSMDEYLSLFYDAKDDAIIGEASTHYLCSRTAAKEIFEFNPLAKIIIILRNPVERSYSHFYYRTMYSGEERSFIKAFESSLKLMNDKNSSPDIEPFAQMSFYATSIKRYINEFGSKSVKILLFDDLIINAEKVCMEVFEFLNVERKALMDTKKVYNRTKPPKFQIIENLIKKPNILRAITRITMKKELRDKLKTWLRSMNARKRVPPMDEKIRQYLADIFRNDVQQLEKLLGRTLEDHWLKNI